MTPPRLPRPPRQPGRLPAAVGVGHRPARRPRPAPRPVPARLDGAPGQDAAGHRRHRDHPLHRSRRPGRRPDVRHRHHPGRGRLPRPPRARRGVRGPLGTPGRRQHRLCPPPRRRRLRRSHPRRRPQLRGLLPPGTAGTAALIVTSPPYGPSIHGQVKAEPAPAAAGVTKWDNTLRHRPGQPGQPPPGRPARRPRRDPLRLARCCCGPAASPWSPPGPGGSAANWSTCPAPSSPPAPPPGWSRSTGASPCSPGCATACLSPARRSSSCDNLRRARRHGQPWHLIVHEDVLIFRKPGFPGSSRELKGPQRELEGPEQRFSHVGPADADELGAVE